MLLIFILLIIIIAMGYIISFLYKAFKEKNVQYCKVMRNFLLLYDWLELERTGSSVLADTLYEAGYHKIMIYGWGYLGKQVYKELENTQIIVQGVLDRRRVETFCNVPTYSLQNELPAMDAIILTVLYDTDVIRKNIADRANCPIISLEELIK